MSNFPSFFESIFYTNGRIPYIRYHYERLLKLAELMKIQLGFNLEELDFRILSEPINATHAKIKLRLSPADNQLIISHIEVMPVPQEFINPVEPISLCIYRDQYKPSSPFSNFKFENDILYKDSIEYANKNGFHHSLILNEKEEIIESSICNLFLVKEHKIFTPPLSSGGVSGVMRRMIMEAYPVEEKKVHTEELELYDELFLSNAVRGILLVNQVDDRKLNTQYSNKLRQEMTLNS